MQNYYLIACILFCVLTGCKTEPITEKNDYFDIIRPEFTGDLAYKSTEYVAQFWRVAGNEGFNKSIYKVVEELEAAGYVEEEKASESDRLTYRIETREMTRPTWEPVDAQLTVVGEEKPLLDFHSNWNMIYQNSASTPENGLTGELVHINEVDGIDMATLKDKIIYVEGRFDRQQLQKAIENGALGFISYNNPSYLQPEKNKTSIQFRGMRANAERGDWAIALSYQANEYLKEKMTQGPTKVHVNIKTKLYPSEELTVVADVIGKEFPKERLVFSAHVQEPGANDNASGVGVQLEMAALTATLLKENKTDFKRTMTFLWGDEIISTRRYIQEDSIRASNIKWGISLDMVGEDTEKTGGSFLIEKMPDPSAIWTRGNDKHTEWGGRKLSVDDMQAHYFNDFIIDKFKKQGKFAGWTVNNNPYEGGSDHIPFLRADIPGLLLWHFTDQFYHTDNDDIDKVSQETLKNVGIGALASAYELVNADATTGITIVSTLKAAFTKRLNGEFELSKKALNSGGDKQEEILILNTWSDWYHEALESVKDVQSTVDDELNELIRNTQSELETLKSSMIAELNRTKNVSSS